MLKSYQPRATEVREKVTVKFAEEDMDFIAAVLGVRDAVVGAMFFLSRPMQPLPDKTVVVLREVARLFLLHKEHDEIAVTRRDNAARDGLISRALPELR